MSHRAGEIDLAALRAHDRLGLLGRIDRAVVVDLPLRARFRGLTHRDGVLLHGPAGWGEVAPFWDYDADASAPWLASALEQAVTGHVGHDGAPLPLRRSTIPVNLTVPELDPGAAHALAARSQAITAKVKVSGAPHALEADLARLRAVRSALGPHAAVRIDVNGAWDLPTAVRVLPLMQEAAGGLEYVEQPCASAQDLAAVRQQVGVPVAADESVRLSADPLEVVRLQAADVVVLKVAPLGGVRRALALAHRLGLPAVVSSALDTGVGIAAGLALAAAVPHLPYACGLGTVSLLVQDVTVPSPVPRAGSLPVRGAHVSNTLLGASMAGQDLTNRWDRRLGHILAALTTRREREAQDPSTAIAGIPL